MKKIKVSILGATGLVGQQLVKLLNEHPYFEIEALVASDRSAGIPYRKLIPESKNFNVAASELIVQTLAKELTSSLLFCCLDAQLAAKLELELAQKHWVISNASSYRLLEEVPLLVPEVNGFQLSRYPEARLIKNPNCVVAILAIALAPIIKHLGLESLQITTMQSLSGAGYPGVSALDIQGNVLPYIEQEEEKIIKELKKIFVDLTLTTIQVRCFRVAVEVGHLLSIFFTTREACTKEHLVNLLTSFKNRAQEALINYNEALSFPQPAKHLPQMEVNVGHLDGEGKQWQMTILGNNLVRGAAGAALANAEYLYHLGKL